MADQSDILDALQALSLTACYPCGPSPAPSVTTQPIDIGQGWPLAADLDKAIAAGTTIVSIYSVPGTTGAVTTPFDWMPGVIVAPIHGMAGEATGDGFLLTGAPNLGEYATVIVDGQVYSVAACSGDTVQIVAASLVAEIVQMFPGVSWSVDPMTGGAAVTITDLSSLVVRIGASATVGQISHRQRQNFQITVWAPTPSDRTTVARAIDVALKRSNTIVMPDTSTAIILATGTNLDDKREETSGFHRALIFNVEWDTLDEFPAWEITSVNINLPNDGEIATAIS